MTTYDSGDSEVAFVHLLCEPLDLPARVTEDHGLRHGHRSVDVTQTRKLPLLFLYL